MNAIRCSVLLTIVLAMTGPMTSANQEVQADSKKQAAKSNAAVELKTAEVTLSHLDADTARSAILRLGYGLQITSIHTNPYRLLLRGTKDEVDAVVKEVVPLIDVPGTQAAGESIPITYISLANEPDESFMPILATIVPTSRDVQYQLDRAKRLLVVRAKAEAVEEIRRLLAAIDKPEQTAAPLMLQFFFIRGQIAAPGSKPESQLPAELAPVGKALMSNGLTGLALIGPMVINTSEGEKFTSNTYFARSVRNNRVRASTLEVRGRTTLLDADGLVQVEVVAGLNDMGDPVFETSTTLSTRLGAYTILAAAAAVTGDPEESRDASGVIALALRVTRGDE